MVVVELQNSRGEDVHRAGPFPWVRFHSESLRVGPDDEEIGHHQGGVWHIRRKTGTKLYLHGSSCSIRFEDSTGEAVHLGPFERVEMIDGAAYTLPGHVLLARLDEQNKQWYAYEAGRWWHGLVIEKCEGASEGG